jgi:amino acid transporter
MSWYFELKTAHVLVACLLLAVCAWSLLPLRYKTYDAAFRRMLWVIPLGLFQGVLGMATLAVEPEPVSPYETAILVGGLLLLGLLWLAGLAGVKVVALKGSQRQKKIQALFVTWISVLLLVFFAILYVMVNFSR